MVFVCACGFSYTPDVLKLTVLRGRDPAGASNTRAFSYSSSSRYVFSVLSKLLQIKLKEFYII